MLTKEQQDHNCKHFWANTLMQVMVRYIALGMCLLIFSLVMLAITYFK